MERESATAASTPSSSSDSSAQQTRPQSQPRKRTYLVRKEEREELLKEVAFLEERVAFLRQHTAVPPEGDRAEDDASAPFCAAVETLCANAALCHAVMANSNLQDAVLKNQLMHAGMKSMMAEANRPHWNAPLHTPIRLGADFAERCATLRAMKLPKLLTAYNLVQERTRFLDLSRRYSNQEAFDSAEGHACTTFCDVNPLEGVHSVQQVHAAMQFAVQNIEIVVSETLGLISVREDLDDYGDGVCYARLLTSLSSLVEQEINMITLLEYDSDLDVAMMVLSSVDEDVRYPFSPSTRIRRDVAGVVMASRNPTTGAIVLRRVMTTQVHRPANAHLLPAFHTACATTLQWFEMTLRNLREHCVSPSR